MATNYRFIEARANTWRNQLYVKGRPLRAHTVRATMTALGQDTEGAGKFWNLPTEAIEEIVSYCDGEGSPVIAADLQFRIDNEIDDTDPP